MNNENSDRARTGGSAARDTTLHLRAGGDEADAAEPMDNGDAEARMRQALGLFGQRPSGGDRFPHNDGHGGGERRTGSSGPGARRHRFVQDGEVPVSVVRGNNRGVGRPAGGETDRTAERHGEEIAHERAARAEAERRLADREIQVRTLQTRIGHAELERDAALAEAREWRDKAGEAAAMLAARESVDPEGAARGLRGRGRRRPDEPAEAQLALGDPEPVKWWL